ncbi:MAG: isocitrate dehydrogenase, partial [Rhodoferax sp.]|nr:isocitrate dehydrogenase [Rhodoferax sp.]
REAHGAHLRHDFDVQPAGVVFLQAGLDLLDDFVLVRAVGVEPEHGGHAGVARAGDGGSAPKHVQQLVEENHLRWDSLGEFLALAVSLEDLGIKTGNDKAKLLAKTLDAATGKLLDHNKGPSPKTGQLDNRGSQFYIAMYWAQALAEQSEDKALQAHFAPLAKQLTEKEAEIVEELRLVQGKPVDIGGYYMPDPKKTAEIMRPSPTFNAAIAAAQV